MTKNIRKNEAKVLDVFTHLSVCFLAFVRMFFPKPFYGLIPPI